MPPKLSSSKQRKNIIAGSSAVVDSIDLICDGCNDTLQKKEALVCSACKVWLHRYCAGVPISRYPDISQSFVCIPCSLIANSSMVTELKNEVDALKTEAVAAAELRNEIAALKAEIAELKSALEASNKKLEASTTAQNQRETTKWSTIVKKSPRKNSRRGPLLLTTNTSRERSEAENSGASAANRLHTTENRHPKRKRVVVPGMRRVWGTLKHTPGRCSCGDSEEIDNYW